MRNGVEVNRMAHHCGMEGVQQPEKSDLVEGEEWAEEGLGFGFWCEW